MPELSSTQVCKLTDLTPRQIQWADEQGIVKPLSKSRRRRYSESQAMQFYIIAQLRAKGMTLHAIRKIQPKLQNNPALSKPRFVCTNGKRVASCDGALSVIKFALGCAGPIYVIEIPNWESLNV